MIYIAKDSTKPEFLISYEGGNCDKNILYHPVDASPNITSPCGIHLRVRKPALKSDLSFETCPVSLAVQDLSSLTRHHPQPAPKCTKMHQNALKCTKIAPNGANKDQCLFGNFFCGNS